MKQKIDKYHLIHHVAKIWWEYIKAFKKIIYLKLIKTNFSKLQVISEDVFVNWMIVLSEKEILSLDIIVYFHYN